MNKRFWMAFVACYIFARGYENKGLAEGLRYGGLVGLLISVPMAYDSYVVYPIPYRLALSWLFTGLAYWLILGAILSLIYKRDAATA